MSHLSPAINLHIARPFGIGSLELKIQNKTAYQEELSWPSESKRPVLCLPAGMTEQLGGALLEEVLPGVLSLPFELLVLGRGSAKFGSLFTKLAKEQQHRIHIVPDNEENIQKMLAAADMALFLKDSPKQEILSCLNFGVVPIAPEQTDHLEDYDPIQETGNSFLFDDPSKWNIFASIVRAIETHKFPFDWRTIQRHCMETVHRKEKMSLL